MQASVQPDDLDRWCVAELAAAPVRVLFRSGHLSVVTGVLLSDGRSVVVKVRPDAARIAGCIEVQRRLHAAGYPCPRPLAGPSALGSMVATAEALVAGGSPLERGGEQPGRFAAALADLVAAAPAPEAVPSLEPPPPWAWPSPRALWPAPDDLACDLNALGGPAWLDEVAVGVRSTLLSSASRDVVVGHTDFESQNVRWSSGALHAVHDWDSVAALPETAIAGLASAMFTATGAPHTEAGVDESRRFLEAYQAARGLSWSTQDIHVAWTAGLWVRAFNAKKAYAAGDHQLGALLQAELAARQQAMGSPGAG
jgi:hypothetical protein